MARRADQRWQLWAIEINLRKGGTTHPFQLAATAAGARFERGDGQLRTPDGATVFYEASHEISTPSWHGLLPEQMLDALVQRGLYFQQHHPKRRHPIPAQIAKRARAPRCCRHRP